MWGKVTLYNTYQLFVQLTSKKKRHPVNEFYEKYGKDPASSSIPQAEYQDRLDEADQISVLWEGKPEIDLLTLYFNATDALPVNSMRRLVSNANNALKSMSGAEKMMSSVYGIAITAMSFFTDPTISTLTSGTPSQNADLQGMSFPRQFGVRFHSAFLEKYHLIGMQARWMSFNDKGFTKDMGKDFYHEDTVSREGWAKYYFKGKYPRDVAYVRLQIVNPKSGMLIRSFYFQFRKAYQTSLDARYYVTDPVLGEKIVKNGTLIELRPYETKSGEKKYLKARTTFSQKKVVDVIEASRTFGHVEKEDVNTRAIIRTQVRYSEKPKMVFLVKGADVSNAKSALAYFC